MRAKRDDIFRQKYLKAFHAQPKILERALYAI